MARPAPRGLVALVGVALLGLAACDDLARRGLVAHTGEWTLSEDRLAELLVLAQPFPLDSAATVELARHWQGAAALALRSAAGDSLLGAEALEAASWLDRREALLAADREARLATAAPSPEAVAAAFQAGSLRLVAHVLRRVGPETSSAERVLQQRTAERILGSILEGASWNDVVAESEDAASRDAAGLLGLFARGELPSNVDRAVFQLEPGQVSGVVQTRQGFHILYRPRFEEISRIFGARLRERRLVEADAAAGEEARATFGMELSPVAAHLIGLVAEDPDGWLDSATPLATWDGGAFAAADAARYLVFFPSSSRAELAAAAEEPRADLVRELATRELRLAGLHEQEFSLDSATVAGLAEAHAEEIEYWTQALALDASDAPSRSALARQMEMVVSRQGQARSLSPLFEAWLLARAGTEVRATGILAAIVKARAMLEGAGASAVPGS